MPDWRPFPNRFPLCCGILVQPDPPAWQEARYRRAIVAVSLTAAKNLAEVIELQAAYWRKQFGALADQAKEVRALSTQVTADVAKQVKEQVTRGVDELRKAS